MTGCSWRSTPRAAARWPGERADGMGMGATAPVGRTARRLPGAGGSSGRRAPGRPGMEPRLYLRAQRLPHRLGAGAAGTGKRPRDPPGSESARQLWMVHPRPHRDHGPADDRLLALGLAAGNAAGVVGISAAPHAMARRPLQRGADRHHRRAQEPLLHVERVHHRGLGAQQWLADGRPRLRGADRPLRRHLPARRRQPGLPARGLLRAHLVPVRDRAGAGAHGPAAAGAEPDADRPPPRRGPHERRPHDRRDPRPGRG